MSVSVRPATLADARQMVGLILGEVTTDSFGGWMDSDSAYSAWHLAETDLGEVIGFQRIGPSDTLPSEACDIATFLSDSAQRMEAGSKLFDTTAHTARLLGYLWISAAIDVANDDARINYQSHGFRQYAGEVGKLTMRYDLD